MVEKIVIRIFFNDYLFVILHPHFTLRLMNTLDKYLKDDSVRGVVHTAAGEVIEFRNPGVKDLYCLVDARPHALEGGFVCDRVIGRGAALLMVLGKVKRVYAGIISTPAVDVLHKAGVEVDCGKQVPNIINRDGTGTCPVENLTIDVDDPAVSFERIKEFLISKNIIAS